MGHKRNGKAAKIRRQQRAQERSADPKVAALLKEIFQIPHLSHDEMMFLVAESRGSMPETCEECGNHYKLSGYDCMMPHCVAIREEVS